MAQDGKELSMTTYSIPEATGASIVPKDLQRENRHLITDFGASGTATPKENTTAINNAIRQAAKEGGGTVVFPAGTFPVYTILLQSNVNLFLEEGCVVAAAIQDLHPFGPGQPKEGDWYEEPEANPYLGLQDHGHSYFANSLVYGADLENIMIYGSGLFTGGYFHPDTGILEYVLQGGDPPFPADRRLPGHRGQWFGNKGIALVRCRNVVFSGFSVTIGGHFAIITEGCENLYVEHVLVDTTRDAFDIDCCRDVTVRHCTCNSLTDDGLCLKASFGAGIFRPLENVLIEDCIVSGYDAGSVYAGSYTRDKLVAEDRCGPTGRVKFGTESTCGYHRVTIRRVRFDRSRGFCLEAVDCSSLTDVIFEDCVMDNVSSSPIFLRAGDRGRFPVTGNDSSPAYPPAPGNVRLDRPEWILPDDSAFHCYPIRRYTPSYRHTRTVTIDGHSSFEIVDGKDPVRCNPALYEEREGHYYLKAWNPASHSYEPDLSREIPREDLPLYANGVGCGQLASIENVRIRNVKITNVDPRYPILLMGLVDSPLQNVTLENISVEYRGGLTMEHAVEQRQLNTDWSYSQFHAKPKVQSLPWLVNTFFLKNEGLLPRVSWDPVNGGWIEDPCNVPELPDVYPEPSNWGILPAFGLYARHVEGLCLKDVAISCKIPDGRYACVLDDVHQVSLKGLQLPACALDPDGSPLAPIAAVTHHYRRHTNAEYVPGQPYFATSVTGLEITSPCLDIARIQIHAPAPGTPADHFYPYPTVPCPESGYSYPVDTDSYPLPLTVHRPFLLPMAPRTLSVGEPLTVTLTARNPATDLSARADTGIVYNERVSAGYHSVKGADVTLSLYCRNLPRGAAFDPGSRVFTWTPDPTQTGTYEIVFVAEDGILPEEMVFMVHVVPC